jgi:hypothetical protein
MCVFVGIYRYIRQIDTAFGRSIGLVAHFDYRFGIRLDAASAQKPCHTFQQKSIRIARYWFLVISKPQTLRLRSVVWLQRLL